MRGSFRGKSPQEEIYVRRKANGGTEEPLR